MTQPTILITGGSGKFGRQYVAHFVNKGWKVLFTSTTRERADELEASFGSEEALKGFVVDFSAGGAAEKLVADIANSGVRVNHLVNNARSLNSLKVSDNGLTSRSDFLAEYMMDVVVPYELAMALYLAQPTELKTITNIGSQYGLVAATPSLYNNYPRQSPIQYGVAKAALNHLTKELAVRFAGSKIRVNCIAYGGVEGRVDNDFKERYARLNPSGRMLSESEIAGPVDFLVGEGSSAMTGHIMVVDGGWTAW